MSDKEPRDFFEQQIQGLPDPCVPGPQGLGPLLFSSEDELDR